MTPQTESEKYLALLCRRSFLSLWSYPNLYTDKGRINGKGVGRELCDLLVIFGDDVIIFSDKHIRYKDTGNVSVDWPRWHRSAVEESYRQLYGAESWIRRFPTRLYLDPECNHPFPLSLPPREKIRFHRVAVTRGSYEACAKFYGGNSLGSLRLSTDSAAGSAGYFPFTVGIGSKGKPFVHVLDEFTLDIVFRELDTVSDFVAYPRKKESFLSDRNRATSVDGEEQLLGIYLKNINAAGEHDIVLPSGFPSDVDFVYLQEGFWEEVCQSPQLRAKKEADRDSYVWDRLVELFIQIGDPKTLGVEIDQNPGDLEIALRVMAAESRLSRRQLAHALLDARSRSSPRKAFARMVLSNTFPDAAYISCRTQARKRNVRGVS